MSSVDIGTALLTLDAVMDVAEMRRRVFEDEELFHKLLHLFREDYASASEKLELLLSRDDLPAARQLLHSIAGSAGNLSAQALISSARRFEKAIKHNDFSIPISVLKKNLTEDLTAVNNAIENYFSD